MSRALTPSDLEIDLCDFCDRSHPTTIPYLHQEKWVHACAECREKIDTEKALVRTNGFSLNPCGPARMFAETPARPIECKFPRSADFNPSFTAKGLPNG